jgi:ankyrin repeat protein
VAGINDVRLIDAIRGGDTSAVELLLSLGADPCARELPPRVPWYCRFFGSFFRRRGPKFADDTALMVAVGFQVSRYINAQAIRENLEIVRLLLDSGADVNGTNNTGATPLRYAVSTRRPSTIRLLFSHGADQIFPTREVRHRCWLRAPSARVRR